MRRALALTVLWVGWCGSGCDGSVNVDARLYRCVSNSDCGAGASCLNSVCVLGDGGGGSDVDSGTDAGLDAGVFDAGGGADAGADASVDAGVDAGIDAGIDAGVDAGLDAGAVDAGLFCVDGWCWLQPTPFGGATFAMLSSPNTFIVTAAHGRAFLFTDGGAQVAQLATSEEPTSGVLGPQAGEVWLSGATTLFKVRSTGTVTSAPMPLEATSLVRAMDGTIWAYGPGRAYRYDAPNWSAAVVPTPGPSCALMLQPLGAQTVAMCVNASVGQTFSLVQPGATPQPFLSMMNMQPQFLLARSAQLMLLTLSFPPLQVFLDGGTSAFTTPSNGNLSYSTDNQLTLLTTPDQTLFRKNGALWSQVSTSSISSARSIDLFGDSTLVLDGTLRFQANGVEQQIIASPKTYVLVAGADFTPQFLSGSNLYTLVDNQFKLVQPLPSTPVFIHGRGDGSLFYTTSSGQITSLVGGVFATALGPLFAPTGLAVLDTGEVLTTGGGKLYETQGSTTAEITGLNFQPLRIARVAPQTVWMSNVGPISGALVEYKLGGKSPKIIVEADAGFAPIVDLCSNAEVAVATQQGVYLWNGSTLVKQTALPAAPGLLTCGPGHRIIFTPNTTYVGVNTQVLYNYDGGSWGTLPRVIDEGLRSSFIEPNGHLWLTTNDGQVIVRP